MTHVPNERITGFEVKRSDDMDELALDMSEKLGALSDEISEQLFSLHNLFKEVTDDPDDDSASILLDRTAHLIEVLHSYSVAHGKVEVYAAAMRSLPKIHAFDMLKAISEEREWTPSLSSIINMVIHFAIAALLGALVYAFFYGG